MLIIPDDLNGPEMHALLEVHFARMLASSPQGNCHALDFDRPNAPDIAFWSIRDGENLAGCGALKEHAQRLGEIKSMRTHAGYLRRGVGAQMLAHIIAVARARGYARLSLETGSGDAFVAAARLYERHGFTECAPFADYVPDPFSRFMTLAL